MDRSGFLKRGALAAVTAALKAPATAAPGHKREFVLQNNQLSWHSVQSAADGVQQRRL